MTSLTVRVRVALLVTAVVALGAVTAALAQWGLNESASRVERLHNAADARNGATRVRRGVGDLRRFEIIYVTVHDATKIKVFEDRVKEATEDCALLAKELEPENRPRVAYI
ncbi:MAG: hypothetical protein ACAI25_11925, partial [Planctomycetota bacterium]